MNITSNTKHLEQSSPHRNHSANTALLPSTNTSTAHTSDISLLARIAGALTSCIADNTTNSIVNTTNSNVSTTNASTSSTGLGAVKLRWNACYAIANLLKNPDLVFIPQPNWLPDLFSALVKVTQSGKNFKTRINAALALSCLEKRAYYGASFTDIVAAVVSGLENTEDIEVFSEYKYKENLRNQLSSSFVHLIKMGDVTDFQALANLLSEKSFVILQVLDFILPKLPLNEQQNVLQKMLDFYTFMKEQHLVDTYQKRIAALSQVSDQE